jgi:hypothetical protein
VDVTLRKYHLCRVQGRRCAVESMFQPPLCSKEPNSISSLGASIEGWARLFGSRVFSYSNPTRSSGGLVSDQKSHLFVGKLRFICQEQR